MFIKKEIEQFTQFEKKYWLYFLELEEQFLTTKRYVSFDKANFKTFSVEYLKLFEAVCSEIDVVGRVIAHKIDSNFNIQNANIQKWWFTIQDWYHEDKLEPIKIQEELQFSPWSGFNTEQFINKQGSICYRLTNKAKMPYWWISYNKVKHNRTLDDPKTQEQFFHRANLENVCYAFSGLYLLEKRYLMSVGEAKEYNRCQKSKLFENNKPLLYIDEDGDLAQVDDE